MTDLVRYNSNPVRSGLGKGVVLTETEAQILNRANDPRSTVTVVNNSWSFGKVFMICVACLVGLGMVLSFLNWLVVTVQESSIKAMELSHEQTMAAIEALEKTNVAKAQNAYAMDPNQALIAVIAIIACAIIAAACVKGGS